MFEKWLAKKGLKGKVTSRLSIIKQEHILIAGEANHTVDYALS